VLPTFKWVMPKAGILWIDARPSMGQLAVYLNQTVHECAGDVYFGGEVPLMCQTTSAAGAGTKNVFNFTFSDGPATIQFGAVGTPHFTDQGLACVFDGGTTETFTCAPVGLFAASYSPSGAVEFWTRDTSDQSGLNAGISMVGLCCVLFVLNNGKQLTAGTYVPLTPFERNVVVDGVLLVSSTAIFELLRLGSGALHPFLSVVFDRAQCNVAAFLVAVAIAVNGTHVLISTSPIWPFRTFWRGGGTLATALLGRVCYEMVFLISITVLTPALFATEYHAILGFAVGVAIAVIVGRDVRTISAGAYHRGVLVGGILAVNLSTAFLLVLPLLVNASAVPPTFEVEVAILVVAQAVAAGCALTPARAQRTQ
jgi:hypothetical protein